MKQFEMPVTAVKQGTPREKDGRKFRMDTATFIMPDGDSFRLDFNGFSIPMNTGDIAEFGIRSGVDAKGYDVVSLNITGFHAAAAASASSTASTPTPHKG